jgi:hypothetical protein
MVSDRHGGVNVKRIINGKKYDTETATLVGTMSNGYSYSDFNYRRENLFITKKGAFFVEGRGGPLSRWARSCGGNSVTSGEGIEVLTKEEALKWCEENEIDTEEMAKYFDVEEA